MKKKSLLSICLLMILMAFATNLKAQWWTETPPTGKLALHRLRNVYSGKHIIATTSEAYSLSQQVNGSGFTIWAHEGRLGYIQVASNSYPIYRYYRSSNNDHYATLSSTAPAGYSFDGILGYAAPVSGSYSGIPSLYYSIHAYYRGGSTVDRLYSNNYGELGAGGSPWVYEGIAFNIWL